MLVDKRYKYRTGVAVTRRRGKYTKRFVIFTLFLLGVVGYIAGTRLEQPVDKSQLSISSDKVEEPKTQLESPLIEIKLPALGQSAVGSMSQGVVKKSENEIMAPIASVTKIITALVILEKRPMTLDDPGDTITFTAQDEQYYHDYLALNGTLSDVTAGLTMTQYDALQALLLPSSNNMADTLVDRYFENREEFLEFANKYVQERGLKNTRVGDASGFSPESQSTPSDLIKLGQLVLNNPVIKQIVAKPSSTITIAGDIPNYNPLIEEPNVIGVKPGATDEAGYCLLFAAEITGSDGKKHTMIASVMGYQDRGEYIASALSILDQSRDILIR